MTITRQLFILLIVLAGPVVAGNDAIEVIELRYRTAEQVIPILQPLIKDQGAITGMQNKLIIRATPSAFNDIKQLISQIDTAPRQLIISVRQTTQPHNIQENQAISGQIQHDKGSITLPERATEAAIAEIQQKDSRVAIGASRREAEGNESILQKIRVLEGSAASIYMGEARPIQQRTIIQNGQIIRSIDQTEYHEATTGFNVTPYISGNQIRLEIAPQKNSFDTHNRIETQQAKTTVSGQLGEWITVGVIDRQVTQQSSQYGQHTAEAQSDIRYITVKVEDQ